MGRKINEDPGYDPNHAPYLPGGALPGGSLPGGGTGYYDPNPVAQAGEPSAIDPHIGSAVTGPAGVGGGGGYGFTNIQHYLYANPTETGAGTGRAPTPTGMSPTDYSADMHGFAPSGGYTPGMSAWDNAENQVYSRSAPVFPDIGAMLSGSTGSGGGAGDGGASSGESDDSNRRGGGAGRRVYPF